MNKENAIEKFNKFITNVVLPEELEDCENITDVFKTIIKNDEVHKISESSHEYDEALRKIRFALNNDDVRTLLEIMDYTDSIIDILGQGYDINQIRDQILGIYKQITRLEKSFVKIKEGLNDFDDLLEVFAKEDF